MSRRIRVLLLNHTAKLGGGELALKLLVQFLDKSQVEPQVLLFEDGPLAALLTPYANVSILPLPERIQNARKDSLGGLGTFKKLLGLPLSVLHIALTIRRMDIDLVHTNSLKADLLGGVAARLAGKTVIWHIRDRIEPDYLPTRVVQVFRRLARIIPQGVLANSHATMESLHLPSSGSPPVAAQVIHDGCDMTAFPVVEHGNGDLLTVGLIGRISPWKGQDVFLRAIHRIQDEVPHARFEIIGSALFGEEAFERKLKEMCDELGLNECVVFRGFVTDIPKRIARLDLVVHASTLSEPFGQVVIEGMAAGKPVIATRGGGVSEIVEDNVSGLLVPMKDAEALGDAMLLLLQDAQLRERLGKGAFRRVQEHFRIEYTAEKVLRFYQQVRAGRKTGLAESDPTLTTPAGMKR